MSIFQFPEMECTDLYVDVKQYDNSSTSDANDDPILEYLRASASQANAGQEDSEKPIDVVDLADDDDDGDNGEDEVKDSTNCGSIILPFGIKRSNEEVWDGIPSVIDLDRPLTNTSAILNHCLRMARAQGQAQAQDELNDLSTMETFADEELFLEQPPLKKRRFWPVQIQEETEHMFEGQGTGSCLYHREFQNCLEHSVDKLRQENAELRQNLGITAQEALVSMAAEQANNGAGYADEDYLCDPFADDGPRWETDYETLSFLAKYLG